MIVMKFGGSSLATAEKIRRAAHLVRAERDRDPVVVVSAMGRSTDALLAAAEASLSGEVDTSEIDGFHEGIVDDLGLDRRVVEPLQHGLSSLLHGIALLGELTDRTRDAVMSFGERMSSRVMAAVLGEEGVPATAVNAWDLGLITDSRHGRAAPLPGIEERIAGELGRLALVPVVTGFVAKDGRGSITTLGRSGSDYTASIIGGAAGAGEVQIWTDVDGVMTADPGLVPEARSLPVLSFDEASELAYYGAEVLHPNTLIPAIRRRVPVRVLNTARPDDEGTRIVSEPVLGDLMAKSIVYKEDVSLITLASPRLMSAVELLASAFAVLKELGVAIHMATTSEATVSMVTDRSYDGETLERAREDLSRLATVQMEHDRAIVCVVGEELRGRAGVLARIFEAVSARGIKARMVSQSASEINVAFLVDNREVEPAVRALHDMLTRSRARPISA